MQLLQIVGLISLIVSCGTKDIKARNIEICYVDEKDPYIYVGTKTAYHFVHEKDTDRRNLSNCEPSQIWSVIRHGTRFPNKRLILKMLEIPNIRDEIVANHEIHNNGLLCKKDLENLKLWKLHPDLNVEAANVLTLQGIKDISMLAERISKRYPTLFSDKTKNHQFRATDTQRTRASMNAFIERLFGNSSLAEQTVIPIANDTLLKGYRNCKAWKNEVKSSYVNKEINEFINGSEFQTLVKNVSRRLGYAKNILSDLVFTLYDTCAFEKAWSIKNHSSWCAVFTKDEMKIMEYKEDLYRYYHASYGINMSSKMACPLVRDLYDHFSKLEKGGNEEPNGVFYFSHATMIQLLFTTLNFFKESEPLKASNFKTMHNRKWRTSFICPFASNIAAVYYKCHGADASDKVAFYVEEKPVRYEPCSNDLCDWKTLKEILLPVVSNCNMIEFCNN